MMLLSINPYSEEIIAQYNQDNKSKIFDKIEKSYQSYQKWKNISLRQRAVYLSDLSDTLRKNKLRLAEMAAKEMGKPIAQALAEVEKSANSLSYYADNGGKFLKAISIPTSAQQSYVSFQPLGTILAIMPWNFPFWQVFRAMGPILMAGNTMLLKHASNVSGCVMEIMKIIEETNMPSDIFQPLLIEANQTEQIIAHPSIQGVIFTGSSKTGAIVAKTAAKHLKKQVLELGGSDPYIILPDADMRKAIEICAHARLNNAGQSCIAAKRFITTTNNYDLIAEQLAIEMQSYQFGNPLDMATRLGPMAKLSLRNELHQQVQKSIEMGAELLCGGFIPEQKGFFYPPTVLKNVKPGMPAYKEELFGPVASVIKAEDENDAVRIANDTAFGLGAAIFSRDAKRATQTAEKLINAGSVFVNDFVSSDPRLPFGGIKQSGYGRELSNYGLQEFTNIKTIVVR